MQRESLLSCAHTSYKLINGGRGRQGELPRLERWAEQEERNEFCLFTILLLWRHRQPPLQLVKVNITGQTRWCWRWRGNKNTTNICPHQQQHPHADGHRYGTSQFWPDLINIVKALWVTLESRLLQCCVQTGVLLLRMKTICHQGKVMVHRQL